MSTALPPTLKAPALPSSLLLKGELSKELERELLVHLLGKEHQEKITTGNHPDVHIYRPEEKSGLYAIQTIRAFIDEMGLPPFEASKKVFILYEADQMLPSSSNALLKTLEEPSQDSFVLLVSSRPEALLPTIRSRLHPIALSSSEASEIDVSAYFALAQNRQWPELFEALSEIDESDAEAIFKGSLTWAAKQEDPRIFTTCSVWLAEAQTALAHHVKLRNILVNFFIRLA